MPSIRVARYLVLAAALGASGCSTMAAQSSDLFGEDTGPAEIRIEIRNNNFNDATLHSLKNGSERRLLGTVTGKSSGSFTLTWRESASIQIEIDFLAGGRCTTRSLTADPGDELLLELGITESQTECVVSG